MESWMPYLRLIHFIGFALLFGGTFSSFILIRGHLDSYNQTQNSYRIMHLVACPGLALLLITGLLNSLAIAFLNFKGAGYMHAKLTLVLIILIIMIFDMRGKKQIIKRKPQAKEIARVLQKGQYYSLAILFLCLLIVYLVSFRPF